MSSELETNGHNDFLAGEVDEYKMRVDDDVGDGCLADSDEGVRGLRLYPQVLVGWGINLVAYSIIYTWSFECKKESYRLCASKFDERNYLSFFASSYEITFVLSL